MVDSVIGIAGQFLSNPTIKANASLVFSIATGAPTIVADEVGNPILATSVTATVTLSCWLQQKKPPYADVQEGSYLDSEYFEGRLVNPKNYPFPVPATGDIRITINGRSGLIRQLNVFESPTSQQLNISDKLGRRIKLYARFDQGGG
jgi:hypothetical protein